MIATGTGLAIGLQLAIPAAAITKALQQTAVKQKDGSYTWSYSFTHAGTNYSAVLTATAGSTTEIWNWELAVTKTPVDANGCCDKFVWLTGTRLTETTGKWVINDASKPSTPKALRTVDWKFVTETEKVLTVTADQIDADVKEWTVGGFVKMTIAGTKNTMIIDRNPSNTEKFEIIWDTASKEGSMLSEEGKKTCWDKTLLNAICI